MRGILGVLLILLIAWALSENRHKVALKPILVGLCFQFVIAITFLKIQFLSGIMLSLNALVQAIEKATASGAQFMFGYLAGGDFPAQLSQPGANFIVAFRVLPLVLVVSALSAVLFHWGVLQKVVSLFSLFLQKTFRISGAMGFGVAANFYLGIVEAPLFIRPYLKNMSRSELFIVMSAGMATVAGTVMVLYASLLEPILPGALGHILIASIISAPAVLVIGFIMVPPKESAQEIGRVEVKVDTQSSLDALVKGTLEGVQLLINIIAMIIVLFAMVHLINQCLSLLPFEKPITIEGLFSYIFYPILWAMGVASKDLWVASELMGVKVALNEFVAYTKMSQLADSDLSSKTRMILTYAMCGFANFASVGLIIGALGGMVPERRSEIVSLGFKSLVAGLLATCMTGAVVGLMI